MSESVLEIESRRTAGRRWIGEMKAITASMITGEEVLSSYL